MLSLGFARISGSGLFRRFLGIELIGSGLFRASLLGTVEFEDGDCANLPDPVLYVFVVLVRELTADERTIDR